MTSQAPYELYEGSEGLERLRTDWEALEPAGAKTVFQTHRFVSLWMEYVGTSCHAQPLVATLREEGRVTGIFPACRLRRHGVSLLTWLGGPYVLDYGDVLFDSETADANEFVTRSLDLISRHARGAFTYLVNVRNDATAFAGLDERLRPFKFGTAPYLPIEGSFEDYLKSRSRDLKKSLNRRLRRLGETGDVAFSMLSPNDPGIEPAMERLVAFQRHRFNEPGTRTILFEEDYVRFKVAQALRHPASRLLVLTCDDTIVAASLHVVHNGTFCGLTSGFDPEYAAYSPGGLIQRFAIEQCFVHGWTCYDFGWGDESYKYDWTDLEEPLTTFIDGGVAGAALATMRNVYQHSVRLRRAVLPGRGA